MGGQPNSPTQERETQFLHNVGAFMRGDFAAFAETMRSDIVLELPGKSWLAGTHHGYEAVSRCIIGARHVLDADEEKIKFLHGDDQMFVLLDVQLHGSLHDAEMTIRVKVRYDQSGKWEAISFEPDDLGLFDHVLNAAMKDQATA